MKKRCIQQYTLTGQFICEYSSLREAAIKMNCPSQAISNVARGIPPNYSIKGYLWVYSESDLKIEDIKKRYDEKKLRKSISSKLAYEKDPTFCQRLGEILKRNWMNPEFRKKISQGQRKTFSTLEFKQKRSKISSEINNRLTVKEKNAEGQRKAWNKPGARLRRGKIHSKFLRRPDVQARRLKTLNENGNVGIRRSKHEIQFEIEMKKIFVKDDVIISPIVTNGWGVDFYIKSIDTYVEFDGVYWHGLCENKIPKKGKQRTAILATKVRDAIKNQWFIENQKILIRISDEEYLKNGISILSEKILNCTINKCIKEN